MTRKTANNIGLALGGPGFLLQFVSQLAMDPKSDIAGVALFFGSVLLLAGLAFYARSKGRSAWWCLLGFLSIIGLIILAVLPAKPETTVR